MALVTNLPTLLVKQVESMSETLFEGFFQDEDLLSLVTVVENIKADVQIIIFQKHSGLSGKNVVACPTPTNSTWGFNTVSKTWQPKLIGDRYAECYQTFMNTFAQWLLGPGTSKSDFTGTEMAAFIVEQLDNMLRELISRIFWFGDKGIVAGTGNNLASGEDAYFNPIDGIWAQAFDIVTANALRKSTTGIATYNAAASFALQKFDAAATTAKTVSNALDQVWYDADMRLRQTPKSELRYYVTQSVYDQLEKERKSVTGFELPYNRQEDGLSAIIWNGIPVVAIQLWDRILAAYFGDDITPVKTTIPHRVMLTSKNNLLLGVETSGSLNELDAWYSKDDEKMYAKFATMIDAKIGLNNIIQLAY